MERQTVSALRAAGHDVLWVAEANPQSPDPDVLDWATQESRLLITYDKDFGEISQRRRQPAPFGIILFRIGDDVPADETAGWITHSINVPAEWAGHLWAITIRKRPTVGRALAQ